MNKSQFIIEIKIKLKNLPEHELDYSLTYYNDYFEDDQIDDDVNVELELGSPSKVVSQILSDYAVKDISIKDKPVNFSFSSIWFIILAILASPIALPFSLDLIVVIISLVFVISSIIISFGSVSVAIVLFGIAVLSTSFTVITSTFSTLIKNNNANNNLSVTCEDGNVKISFK